jgi:hypothetical protein
MHAVQDVSTVLEASICGAVVPSVTAAADTQLALNRLEYVTPTLRRLMGISVAPLYACVYTFISYSCNANGFLSEVVAYVW